LQSNQAALDQLEGILTSRAKIYMAAAEHQLGVRTDSIVLAGETINVEAKIAKGEKVGLAARIYSERGYEVAVSALKLFGDSYRAAIDAPAPGAYKLIVSGVDPRQRLVAPVTSTVLVWG
jgi:hypothetical protein